MDGRSFDSRGLICRRRDSASMSLRLSKEPFSHREKVPAGG